MTATTTPRRTAHYRSPALGWVVLICNPWRTVVQWHDRAAGYVHTTPDLAGHADLAALVRAVLAGGCHPAILADLLEETCEGWAAGAAVLRAGDLEMVDAR